MQKGFYPCEVENCTCWFTSESALKSHVKHEHGLELVLV